MGKYCDILGMSPKHWEIKEMEHYAGNGGKTSNAGKYGGNMAEYLLVCTHIFPYSHIPHISAIFPPYFPYFRNIAPYLPCLTISPLIPGLSISPHIYQYFRLVSTSGRRFLCPSILLIFCSPMCPPYFPLCPQIFALSLHILPYHLIFPPVRRVSHNSSYYLR